MSVADLKALSTSELVLVKTNIGGFFFDAILSLDHKSSLTITQHPIETGAAISDHAYSNQGQLTMQIAMSDAMFDIVSGQFSGDGGPGWSQLSAETQKLFNDTYGPGNGERHWIQENAINNPPASRSVTAYQVLKELQDLKIPLKVVTRLHTYQNMLIEDLDVPEDAKTHYGLRATVQLKELFIAVVQTVKISAKPQTTDSTNKGDPKTTQPLQSLFSQMLQAFTGQSVLYP